MVLFFLSLIMAYKEIGKPGQKTNQKSDLLSDKLLINEALKLVPFEKTKHSAQHLNTIFEDILNHRFYAQVFKFENELYAKTFEGIDITPLIEQNILKEAYDQEKDVMIENNEGWKAVEKKDFVDLIDESIFDGSTFGPIEDRDFYILEDGLEAIEIENLKYKELILANNFEKEIYDYLPVLIEHNIKFAMIDLMHTVKYKNLNNDYFLNVIMLQREIINWCLENERPLKFDGVFFNLITFNQYAQQTKDTDPENIFNPLSPAYQADNYQDYKASQSGCMIVFLLLSGALFGLNFLIF